MENRSSNKRIADRYELTRQTRLGYQAPQTESWVARDTVLSRELRAVVIEPTNPHRAQALDGARRSSLFHDPQSVSIISIVDDPCDAVIFTEFPLGTRLSDVLAANTKNGIAASDPVTDQDASIQSVNLQNTKLYPKFVHAVISQLARVISNARHFGLRCLHLNAENIYLTDSDQVIVDGLGVIAPLYGAALDRSPEELDRSEARGLVVFLASLLLNQNFPENPQEHDSVVYQAREKAVAEEFPQQIIDVLNAEINWHGPQSAGDFMRLLAPWDDRAISAYVQHLQQTGALATSVIAANALNSTVSDEKSSIAFEKQNHLDREAAPTSALTGEEASTKIPGDFGFDSSAIKLNQAAIETGSLASDVSPTLTSAPAWPKLHNAESDLASSEILSKTAHTADTEFAVAASEAEKLNSDITQTDNQISDTESNPEVAVPTTPSFDAPAAETTTTATEIENIAAAAEAKSISQPDSAPLGGVPSANTSSVVDPPKEDTNSDKNEQRGKYKASAELTSNTAETSQNNASNNVKRSNRIATIVLLAFLILITIALIFGFWRVLQPLNEADYGVTEQQTHSQSTDLKDDSKSEKPPAPVPELAVPAVIEKIDLISSQPEMLNPSSKDVATLFQGLSDLYDDNPETGWSTWWFARPEVYDRGKLGLVINLQKETEISEIILETRSEGGNIQWKTLSPEATADGVIISTSPSVAEAPFSSDVSLKVSEPIKTKQFVLWIDSIPRTGNENRAEIVNITLK